MLSRHSRQSVIVLAAVCATVLVCVDLFAADKPNVLFIAVDDLNDWVECLDGHPDASTPNIDRLADRGVLFTNAHCQAPICNPSRTSFMLGKRPSTTGIYLNAPWFRTTDDNKDRVTVSQYFRQHGYDTRTTGKIFHSSRVDEPSFAVVGPHPGQRLPIDQQIVTDMPSKSRLWDFGPQQYPEDQFGDFIDASWAIEQLQKGFTGPFFLAVGFYRPHVPFYAPQRFFDQHPSDQVTLPTVLDDDLDDLPPAAIALTHNPLPPSHQWFVESKQWKPAVRAYLSCVTFTDAQIGRLLDTLDASPYANNTIIVLLSDHGFHLGEKQRWAKQSLWERSTRVPLIVSVPGGLRKEKCAKPVELLSVYPTLLELCNLPPRDDLDGRSIVPLLKDPTCEWDHPAVTTYKCNNHAVRDEHFRYIRYADGSEELYDHLVDPLEHRNLANDKQYTDVIEKLAAYLPATNHPDYARSAKAGAKKQGKQRPAKK